MFARGGSCGRICGGWETQPTGGEWASRATWLGGRIGTPKPLPSKLQVHVRLPAVALFHEPDLTELTQAPEGLANAPPGNGG